MRLPLLLFSWSDSIKRNMFLRCIVVELVALLALDVLSGGFPMGERVSKMSVALVHGGPIGVGLRLVWRMPTGVLWACEGRAKHAHAVGLT